MLDSASESSGRGIWRRFVHARVPKVDRRCRQERALAELTDVAAPCAASEPPQPDESRESRVSSTIVRTMRQHPTVAWTLRDLAKATQCDQTEVMGAVADLLGARAVRDVSRSGLLSFLRSRRFELTPATTFAPNLNSCSQTVVS